MKTLSFTEFRKRASEILTLVEKGETISVIRHGKTVAKIVPTETEENTPSWKRPGLRLIRPKASLSKAILAEIEEKGSEQVQAILSSAATLDVSVICVPEIVSALCRLRRERKLSTAEYRNAKVSVVTDIDDATVIGIY